MKLFDTIIVGGGLSGLSAAVELSRCGQKVLLLEQRKRLGGRTYSFRDAATGDIIDNGQHLMMGCYHATRRYLRSIGTEDLAELQPALHIDFLHPSRPSAKLVCPKLPAPLHLVGGLLGFDAIPFMQRMEMLNVAKELFFTSARKEQDLDTISVDRWLTLLGQSEISKAYLWNVMTIGALNNRPATASALMLFRVLRTAFLRHRENASLLIPRVGLSKLLVEPAIEFIRTHGGSIKSGVDVKGFNVQGNSARSIRTADGTEYSASSFISAVPWYAYEKIAPHNSSVSGSPAKEKLGGPFSSSPIIAVHLWMDREVTSLDFAALLGSRIQWIFNRSHESYGERGAKDRIKKKRAAQHLSLVISGAEDFIHLHQRELLHIAAEDLRRVLPLAQNAHIVRSLIVKEKRATFSPSPGLEKYRPHAQTAYDNLYLAGDWTATGFPATIEGAVMSGYKASEMSLRS